MKIKSKPSEPSFNLDGWSWEKLALYAVRLADWWAGKFYNSLTKRKEIEI